MPVQIPRSIDTADDLALIALSQSDPECGSVEVAPNGEIIISLLTGSASGRKEAEALGQLRDWSRAGAGGFVFSSSAGFRLPDGSVRSPDASWISDRRVAALPRAAVEKPFWLVCPDIVVEVLSETDRWTRIGAKIDAYLANGALYAIAFDPFERRTYERGAAPAKLRFDADAIFDA